MHLTFVFFFKHNQMATGLCGVLGQCAVDHVSLGVLDPDLVPAQALLLRLAEKTVQETHK